MVMPLNSDEGQFRPHQIPGMRHSKTPTSALTLSIHDGQGMRSRLGRL